MNELIQAIEEWFRQMEQKSENKIEILIWTIRVRSWIVQIAI